MRLPPTLANSPLKRTRASLSLSSRRLAVVRWAGEYDCDLLGRIVGRLLGYPVPRALHRQAQRRDVARAAFPLPDDDLAALFEAIGSGHSVAACDHSLRLTREWLAHAGYDIDKVVGWLEENGGFCDCEVVANSRDHWQENRR
jgi:hypothetical protein